jgi:hypothetical protein
VHLLKTAGSSIRDILRRKRSANASGSVLVNDCSIVDAFMTNPDNAFLVSFPRTGSHWLRMIMELYFGRPSLVRVFYYPERHDYLTFHTHDLELDVAHSNVLYLYRHPVDTVFSQLYYHQEPLDRPELIVYWSELYGQHLKKWLFQERFTTHKTILTYEGMKQDLVTEFGKVTAHFGQELDQQKLADVAARVTKDEVRRKTRHDPKVVQLRDNYELQRSEFRHSQGDLVWDTLRKHGVHDLWEDRNI